jgi:hypothetical protein
LWRAIFKALELGATHKKEASFRFTIATLSISDTNHPETKSPKFKSHTPNYYSSYSNSHNSSNIFPRSSLIEDSSIYEQTNTLRHINNPFHSCLVMLRKTVEIKKLIRAFIYINTAASAISVHWSFFSIPHCS